MELLECKICGHKTKQLHNHIKFTHKMSSKEYKEKFNVKTLCIIWNKGQTRKTNSIVAKYGDSATKSGKHRKPQPLYFKCWNKGLTVDTDERMARLNVKAQKAVAQTFKRKNYISSLDEKLYVLLNKNNIKYDPQKSVTIDNKYVTILDAFVEPNICIYVDGNYWHSIPRVKNRDSFFTDKLIKIGFKVIRIWENEFDNSEERLLNFIRESVETIRNPLNI